MATFLSPVFWPIYPLTVLRTGAGGLVFPMVGALMTRQVSPREQGVLMGVNAALQSVTSVLGPLSAGVVFDRVLPGAPYWLSAAVLLLAALLLAAGGRRARPGEKGR